MKFKWWYLNVAGSEHWNATKDSDCSGYSIWNGAISAFCAFHGHATLTRTALVSVSPVNERQGSVGENESVTRSIGGSRSSNATFSQLDCPPWHNSQGKIAEPGPSLTFIMTRTAVSCSSSIVSGVGSMVVIRLVLLTLDPSCLQRVRAVA